MSSHRTRALLILSLLGLVLAALTTISPAQALPPTATATQIRVDSVTTPSYGAVPQTAGTPYAVVTSGVDFSVATTFLTDTGTPAPLSNKSVSVTITAVRPDGGVIPVAQRSVPGGATGFTFQNLRINSLQTSVRLHLETTGLKTNLSADSGFFAVNKAVTTAPGDGKLNSVGAGGGAGKNCFPTATQTTCAELNLPLANGTTTTVLLALEACDQATFGCPANRDIAMALVGLGNVYDRTHPASIVYKCDKTACPGGGVSSYKLNVQLAITDAVNTAAPCPAKGIIGGDQEFCLDYRASKRDNASDLNLVLLFFRDVRASSPAG